MALKEQITVNIINRNYAPSPGITGESAAELATFLVKHNLRVNIISVQANYSGGADVKAPVGHVFKVKTFYNGKSKLLRLLGNIYEGYKLIKKSCSLKPDVTICMTDPPLLNMWASLLLGKKRKWFLWSMDLYPEAFVAGKLVSKTSRVYKMIDKLAGKSKPAHVIALGDHQADYIKNKIKEDISFTILPCGIYDKHGENLNGYMRPKWALDPNKIYIGYCGNLGEAHSAEFLKSMIKYVDPGKFTFILSLYGSRAKEVLNYAQGKKGVLILPSVKRHELKYIDVQLASLTKEWVNVCVPSKSVSAVCSGSAFLYNGEETSDNWALLKEAGWLIENTNLDSNIKGFYRNLDKEAVQQKKDRAAILAIELNQMKEKAFTEILAKIVEIKSN